MQYIAFKDNLRFKSLASAKSFTVPVRITSVSFSQVTYKEKGGL